MKGNAVEKELSDWRDKITNLFIPEIKKVIVGQDESIEHLVICLLSGGEELKAHILFEGVPGIGKTRLAKTVARVIGGKFGRIQGVPDLLPSDITGLQVFNQKNQEFEPRLGPIFANVVLVDEINRMPPKTQAALLEAMQEGAVTIGETTFPISNPFIVLATQNPLEFEGVFPLAEAQIDRFLMKVNLIYPSREEEAKIARQINSGEPEAGEVICPKDILVLQKLIRENISVAARVRDYMVSLTQFTRPEQTELERVKRGAVARNGGASPRASIALEAASKVRAFLSGFDFVRPDDARLVAPAVLRHRIRISATENDQDPCDFVEDLIREIIEKAGEKHAA